MNVNLCCVLKVSNELNFITWLKYHLSLGFDKISLISNNSTQNLYKILANNFTFEDLNKIDLIIDNVPFNSSIYHRDRLTKYHQNTNFDWCLYIDDEYLYLGSNCENVKDFLLKYTNEQVKCLSLYWKYLSNPTNEDSNEIVDPLFYTYTLDCPLKRIFPYYTTYVKSFIKKDCIITQHAIHLPECLYKNNDTLFQGVSPNCYDIFGNEIHISINNTIMIPNECPCIYHYHHRSFERMKKKYEFYSKINNLTAEEHNAFTNKRLYKIIKSHYTIEDNTIKNKIEKLL